MKFASELEGAARIFGKGSDSAASSESTLASWSDTDKPMSYEMMAPSIENFGVVDLHALVESIHSTAINETLSMVANNDTEEWIKRNRLLALTQLGAYSPQGCSSSSLYATNLNEETSAVAVNHPSDSYASTESRSLVSSRNSSLTDVAISNVKFETENHGRLVIDPQEGMNSGFHREVKSLSRSDGRTEFVCKSTNQPFNRKSRPLKDSQLKDVPMKKPELQTKRRNCCEPTSRGDNKENVARLPSYNAASLMTLKSCTGFFDSHCHIDLLFNDERFNGTYADYIAQHKDSYPNSYNGCIAVFCKPWTFAKGHVWRKHLEQDNVWGAFGCHPKQAKCYNSMVEGHLERALDHPKVRALGEIGLDYSKADEQAKKEQHFIFRRQLKIARKRNLRVVIHCRDADDDTIAIMKEILPRDSIFHLHCFTGSWKKAQKWIKEFPNVFIGITNLVTFPSAGDTHEVCRRLPLDRLLLETDAPFFVPKKAPKGTRFSHPGMAIHVAAQIAALKNVPIDAVLEATCNNTRHVYNIP